MSFKRLAIFHSKDGRLSSKVFVDESRPTIFYVDLYKDRIRYETRKVIDHSLRFAEDIAENYVLGILKIDTTKMDN